MTRRPEMPASSAPDTETGSLLRASLEAHAPATIETDQAWAATAPRMTFSTRDGQGAARPLAWWARSRARRPIAWRAAIATIATVIALPVLLMGAGVVREVGSLDPGMQRIQDEHLYTEVGQSQTTGGVTVTITAAYADAGRTVFFYHVVMTPQLAQRYQSAVLGSWEFTDAQGNEPQTSASATGGVGECSAWQTDTRSQDCYMIRGPFRADASATEITLSLDITRVYLNYLNGDHSGDHSGYDTLTGDWRFHFTIPMRHMNVGSVEQFFPHLFHIIPSGQQP